MATATVTVSKTRKPPVRRALKTASAAAAIDTVAADPVAVDPSAVDPSAAVQLAAAPVTPEPAIIEPPVPESPVFEPVIAADPVPLADPAGLVEAAAAAVVAVATTVPEIIVPIPAIPAIPSLPTPSLPTPSLPTLSIPKVSNMATASFNGYEELASFGKANLEALIQANTVFVKGIEEMSKEMFGLTQASLETAAAATTAMMSAKTLKDVVELNADFTKAQYEKLVANTTKFGEMGVKLATDTAAPLTARANHVVSTITHASV